METFGIIMLHLIAWVTGIIIAIFVQMSVRKEDSEYYKPIRFIIGIIFIIFVLSYGYLSGYNVETSMNKKFLKEQKHIEEVDTISIADKLTFADSVYNYIIFLNIKHPETVMRQAQIESGNFTSKVFKENKNMFGMRMPFKRANTVIGENNGYAVYEDWQSSIIDYALYQTYSGKGLNKEEYIQMLGRSYAEDALYIEKISK